MKNVRLAALCLFLAGPALLTGQPRLREDSLFAPSLGRVKHFLVLLPERYQRAGRYPVLYLLHGLGGSYKDWTQFTGLAGYAERYDLVIVMPDAENSWYVNSRGDTRQRFEDYIVDDLQEYVRRVYAVDSSRQAIAGLSMGGYGAVLLALRHADKFLFAGGLSSAISLPRDLMLRRADPFWRATVPNILKIFGNTPDKFYDDHDVFYHLIRSTPESAPYFYLVIGTHDSYQPFLPACRRFTDSLRAHGFAYEYHETPGEHSWKFWDREIQPLLKRLDELLRTGSKSLAKAFEKAITFSGIDSAIVRFRGLKGAGRGIYYVDEAEMNDLGYRLLKARKTREAIAVLTLNAEEYPGSGNVYNSLGEAYMVAGDKQAAVRNYERSLSIDPNNRNAVEKLKILRGD